MIKNSDFKPVQSSNITAIAFEEPNILYVRFHSGSTYKYWPFDANEFNAFLNAESIGRYFFQNIKNNTSLNFEKI